MSAHSGGRRFRPLGGRHGPGVGRARPWALFCLSLLFFATQPNAARAWDGPFHYVWTYYLALQVGFNERQAYQIASGTYSFDWDPHTDPLSAAGAEDVLTGADRWRFYPHVHTVWRESLPEVERRMEEFVAGESLQDPDWVLGPEWERYFSALSEKSRPARNWVKYHAFAPASLTVPLKTIRDLPLPPAEMVSVLTRLADALQFACGETSLEECAADYESGKHPQTLLGFASYKYFKSAKEKFEKKAGMTYQEGFKELENMEAEWETLFPPGLRPGPQVFWDQLLTWGGVDGVDVGNPLIAKVREKYSNELWQLALRERNPGPYLHFTQDRVPHGPWDNSRGHAMVGHLVDFISSNPEGAWESTRATLEGLCKFRALLNKNAYDLPPVQTNEPQFLWQPPVGPGLCEYLEGKASERTGEGGGTDGSARLANIRKALERLGQVNPLPGTRALGPFGLNKLTFRFWESNDHWLGQPSIAAALYAVNKQIAQDHKRGLLPTDKNLSLNTTTLVQISLLSV